MELLWTLLVPNMFLLIVPLMYGNIPLELMMSLKGAFTLTMMNFLTAFACQANLAGSIASDRGKGLYLKMSSMPVKAWKEGIGRVFALWIFSIGGMALVLLVGVAYGAGFTLNVMNLLAVGGLILIVLLMASGTGLIIAALIKNESAATHTGVAITLVVYFLGGMAFPYPNLPSFMQVFARLHPVASVNSMMTYLFEGEVIAGYNPLTLEQLLLSVGIALVTFAVGMLLYSRCCWRKE